MPQTIDPLKQINFLRSFQFEKKNLMYFQKTIQVFKLKSNQGLDS